MTDKELREFQLYGQEIMKEVDKFCRKNKIKYSMGEGSLLGAIRHKGFIPWDDDIDVYMTRENFDKFVTTFKADGYRVEYFNTMKRYWLPFAKVRMLKDTKFSTPAIKKISEYTGPRIDIMPLDKVPELTSDAQDKQGKMVKAWKRILSLKVLPISKKKKKLYYFLIPVAKILPYKFIVKKLEGWMKKYNDQDCAYTVNTTGDYNVRKETFPKEYMEDLIETKFEDSKFFVPSHYDEMLTKIYGDYMTPPPVEKRVVKHDIVVRK